VKHPQASSDKLEAVRGGLVEIDFLQLEAYSLKLR
jgi:hypothetical protein